MKASTFLKLIAIVLILFIMNRCAKEEYGIKDIPFQELQDSYYTLHENAIEIPYNELPNLIKSRSENQLVLSNDPIFDQLTEGSIIVSDPDTPYEEFIFRKVVSVAETGEI